MTDDARRQLYNQLQMVLAGHPSSLAARVSLDLLATALAFEARDLESALAACAEVPEDLQRSISRNWEHIQELRGQAAARSSVNRPQ
ncbi:MAG: hypothetical protein ABL893_14420 [Hyphomicrobium sp.]|nr:hypothetical protein [Hyphomicrobium sp.]